MSIPALGGGGSQALQRALMEAAERAIADELGSLGAEDPAATAEGQRGTAAPAPRVQVRRRAAARSSEPDAPLLDEAIVLELGDAQKPAPLEVADGWITASKRGPLETRSATEPQGKRFGPADIKGSDHEPTTPTGPTSTSERPAPADQEEPASGTPQAAPKPESAGEPVTLERLVVVLKRTGIDFRDAYQVLREIRAGAPLPPRAQLRSLWAAADPAAWQERARGRAAGSGPTGLDPQQQVGPQAADDDLRQTPVDDLIRDRSWHRAADRGPGTTSSVPTLQSVSVPTPANQAYVADLSTAEFQRLVIILAGSAPEWFWELRGHRGIRGLAERPAIARLNATRIAGTRLGAWILAILGMALLWYVGLHTGTWW